LAAVILVAALAMLATGRAAPRQVGPCPARPAAALSSRPPADVCIPDGFTDVPMEYFDDYSWRLFVALVWPAASGHRGVADTGKGLAADGPRVFETYKATWEIFHDDGTSPERGFDSYDAPERNACGVRAGFGDLVIGSVSGIDDIGQAGNGALDPPIAAQNGRYVRTVTFFNQLEFDRIVRDRLFLRSALPPVPRPRPERPVVEFPMGSIAVKTAWIDVDGLPASLVKRLYTRRAFVKPAGGGECVQRTVGLVGLHIAQKTPSRPQWIWSSFEQKDTVPPAWPDNPGAFLLHDDTTAPMPDRNPLLLAPLAPEPVRPFNIVRAANAPVHTRTDLSSFGYQDLLAGTPWQYYKLVLTQWPRLDGNQAVPVPATQDGTVPHTFPGAATFSAFANVTMETFDQRSVQLGCMNCHNRARMTTDFIWSVLDHAWPPRLATAARR
jgi:hypothetical protein